LYNGTDWDNLGSLSGPRGPQGAQGSTGPQGAQGFQGPQGGVGVRGPQGPQGAQGVAGPQGAQGDSGDIGPRGPQGAQGLQGPQGFQGPQGGVGVRGPQGPQGAQGDRGPQGFQGPQGTGPQGIRGPQGPQGAQGDRGPQGFQGPQGAGPQGVPGPQGVRGPQGAQGDPGEPSLVPGPQGFRGPQGAQGPQGTGPQGSPGPQGAQGPQGLRGPQGPQGPIGPQGTGPQGARGPQGPQGPLGPQGFQGPQGPVGPSNSLSAVDTTTGSYYPVFVQGEGAVQPRIRTTAEAFIFDSTNQTLSTKKYSFGTTNGNGVFSNTADVDPGRGDGGVLGVSLRYQNGGSISVSRSGSAPLSINRNNINTGSELGALIQLRRSGSIIGKIGVVDRADTDKGIVISPDAGEGYTRFVGDLTVNTTESEINNPGQGNTNLGISFRPRGTSTPLAFFSRGGNVCAHFNRNDALSPGSATMLSFAGGGNTFGTIEGSSGVGSSTFVFKSQGGAVRLEGSSITANNAFTVSGGGITVTGGSTFNNGVTFVNGLTVSSSGITVTGNSTFNNNLTVSGDLTSSNHRATGDLTIFANGTTTSRAVFTTSNFRPTTNGTYNLGGSGNRWATVFAATGTINTSDIREKTEVQTSVLGTSFIKSLRPVSYKFKVGGGIVIGSDENENPIVQDVPGVRTHWGFIAQEVKESIDKEGVNDFAGWILTDLENPDSEQGLRYSEFIAPLTKALQESIERIEVLESQIQELQNKITDLESQ
jgi:hypothetical protein